MSVIDSLFNVCDIGLVTIGEHKLVTLDIENQKRKIRALLEKTTENGCTEAEALAASEAAGRMMDALGIALFDLKEQEKIVSVTHVCRGYQIDEVNYCLQSIANFANCKVFVLQNKSQAKSRFWFFGSESDTTVALYMTRTIQGALVASWERYSATLTEAYGDRRHGKTLRKSFILAMAARIGMRLRDMAAGKSAGDTGKALVLSNRDKQERIENELNLRGIVSVQRQVVKTTNMDRDAAQAGYAAGDTYQFSTGVASGKTLALTR